MGAKSMIDILIILTILVVTIFSTYDQRKDD